MAPTNTDTKDGLDVSEFEPVRGSLPHEVDVADETHPIKQALGPSDHRKLTAHEGTLGERFAFRYSRSEAALREYLANAETACIRAARHELHNHDPETYDSEWFDAHDIPEMLDHARDVTGYHPIIETRHSQPGADRPRFVIEDNGIGISVREFVALRELGLSPSHNDGSMLGSFGQGVMSIFNLVGEYGELTLETWSRLDEANYRERFRITGFNDLPGKREHYGSTWKIPAFCEEARETDVEATIAEYARAMYVPVLHHEYDDDGVEQYKEEHTPQPLTSLAPSDDIIVSYEDDYAEAVASPTIEAETFLVSMPIDRNDTANGDGSRRSPFPFTVRLKAEDGCIYRCTCEGVDHTGLVPVDDEHFEHLLIEDRGAVHENHLVPGDMVGYEDPDTGQYIVPRNVDNELVRANDSFRHPEHVEATLQDEHPVPTFEERDAYVVAGPHEGNRFVSKSEWVDTETTVRETYVPHSELAQLISMSPEDFEEFPPSDASCDVVLPEPVDDRDRLAEHDGAFFEAISLELRRKFDARVVDIIEAFEENGIDHWFDLDSEERELFVLGMNYALSSEKPNDIEIQSRFDAHYDVRPSLRTCQELEVLFATVEHAPRSSHKPNRKGGRTERPVKEVMMDAGDDGDVYMGATIHPDKAGLVWELHDENQVVSVDGAHSYEKYADLFGWIPLKEVTLYNIGEHYDVSDDVIARYERTRDDTASNTGGVTLDELEAETREIKLRSSKRRSYKSTTPAEVADALDGEEGHLLDDDGRVEHLLVFRETAVGGVTVGAEMCAGPISRTVVPNYVADYLEDVDRCYVIDETKHLSAVEECIETMGTYELETFDIDVFVEKDSANVRAVDGPVDSMPEPESVPVSELGEETCCICMPESLTALVDNYDHLSWTDALRISCKSLSENGYITRSTERLAILHSNFLERTLPYWSNSTPLNVLVQDKVTVIEHRHANTPSDLQVTRWRPTESIAVGLLFPRDTYPRDSPEFIHFIKNKRRAIERGYDSGETLVNIFMRLAELSPDDEPVLPSQRNP